MIASCNWVDLLQVSSVQFACYEQALMLVVILVDYNKVVAHDSTSHATIRYSDDQCSVKRDPALHRDDHIYCSRRWHLQSPIILLLTALVVQVEQSPRCVSVSDQ